MAEDREVAGLRCSELLGQLGEYLDGELPPERVAQIRAHLAGCDVCERFGGDMAALVRALRRELADEPLDSAVAERLHKRLHGGR